MLEGQSEDGWGRGQNFTHLADQLLWCLGGKSILQMVGFKGALIWNGRGVWKGVPGQSAEVWLKRVGCACRG